MEKSYYCFAVERDDNGGILKYHILCVSVPENGGMADFSETMSLTAKELSDKGISPINMSIEKSDDGYVSAALEPSEATYPTVYSDETGIHLSIKAFSTRYHRLNPKRVWPSKPELMRTVTVIAETERVSAKFVDYLITNRKLPMLDKNYVEHGYYVCDYNGKVGYLSLVQAQSIGNRFGFTNAKLAGNRVIFTDGSAPMSLRVPNKAERNALDSVNYLDGDIIKNEEADDKKFDKKQLRLYADTFFVYRRQQFSFEQGSNAEKETLDEFRRSIEAFHQTLLHDSVPAEEYINAEDRLSRLLPTSADEDTTYKQITNELIDRIPCRYFKRTDAFNDMLNSKGRKEAVENPPDEKKACESSEKKETPEEKEKREKREKYSRIVALQTLTELAPQIVEHYCGIILAEKEFTELLDKMSEELDFTLKGKNYRLKSPDSLYEKLYERPNETGKSTEVLFEETRDILRYTICFNKIEDYCVSIKRIIGDIMDKYNAQLNGFRNYWTPYVSGDYRGINVSIRLPELFWNFREDKLYTDKAWRNSRYCIAIPSFCVEIQFHTTQSYYVKSINHELYEKTRVSGIKQEIAKKLREEMAANIATVDKPDGAELLYWDSNEYITSLYDFIGILNGELSRIRRENISSRYIDQSLLNRE